MATKEEKNNYSSKAFLADMGEKQPKFKYTDTVMVEVLKDTKFHKKGTQYRTFKLKAEAKEKAGNVKILK